MARETEPESADRNEDGQKNKPLLKFFIIGIILTVLAGGGYFAWTFIGKGKAALDGTEQGQDPSKEKAEEMPAIYPLDSFIVNLLDESGLGNRYLKVSISLEVENENRLKTLEENKPRLRDTILMLLSSQSFEDVHTVDGKIALKHELLYRINQVLGENIVKRTYFTEFVVQ